MTKDVWCIGETNYVICVAKHKVMESYVGTLCEHQVQ